MIKETIIQEIERQSMFSFPQFQERMNQPTYDALRIMKDVVDIYGRWCTKDFMITELGFSKWAVNRVSTIKEEDKKWMKNGIIKKPWK